MTDKPGTCEFCGTEITNIHDTVEFNTDKILCTVLKCDCGKTVIMVPYQDENNEFYFVD